MPGADAKQNCPRRALQPCKNPHDTDDMPRFLSAGLTQYELNNYTTKSPPYHVTEDDVSASLHRLFRGPYISGHQPVRGCGGVIAVLYEMHWKGLLRPSWERGIYLSITRVNTSSTTSLAYPISIEVQTASTAACTSAPLPEKSRAPKADAPRLSATTSRYPQHLVSPLPLHRSTRWRLLLVKGSRDTFWCLGAVTRTTTTANQFIVRFLDDPGPIRITLFPDRYNADKSVRCGAWCVQVHRNSSFGRRPHLRLPRRSLRLIK